MAIKSLAEFFEALPADDPRRVAVEKIASATISNKSEIAADLWSLYCAHRETALPGEMTAAGTVRDA